MGCQLNCSACQCPCSFKLLNAYEDHGTARRPQTGKVLAGSHALGATKHSLNKARVEAFLKRTQGAIHMGVGGSASFSGSLLPALEAEHGGELDNFVTDPQNSAQELRKRLDKLELRSASAGLAA